jgi:hypothetical protein
MSEKGVHVELDRERICVGEDLTGRLRIDGAPPADNAVLSLAWHTHAEGIEDEGKVVCEQTVPLAPDAAFSLKVPLVGPMSYSGVLFSITWQVLLRLEDAAEPVTPCGTVLVLASSVASS